MNNLEIFKAVVFEWNRSRGENLDAWLDYAADNIVMKSIGNGDAHMDFTSARSGKAEFASYLEGHRDTIELKSFNISEYVCEGDRIVGMGEVSLVGRQTGKPCTTHVAIFVKFQDGKMIEIMEYFDTAKLAHAFSPES